MRIRSFPGRGLPNPYIDLFYHALEPHGIYLVGELTLATDLSGADRIDAIHFSWPEAMWRQYRPRGTQWLKTLLRKHMPGGWRLVNLVDRLRLLIEATRLHTKYRQSSGLLKFRLLLRSAQRNGQHVIWTIHNLDLHEGSDWLDRYGYKLLARHTDLLIFHSESAKEMFNMSHRNSALSIVMPHGNYGDVYPTPRRRAVVLEELGLRDDTPIVGCLGAMRDYKGLNIACDAATLLGGHVQLLCAGAPHPSFDIERLRRCFQGLRHGRLIPEFLSDQRFADYTAICDIVLLPYLKITGSGALLAALTLSKGVVASDLPYFREILADEPNAGRLVSAGKATALAQAITDYLQVPESQRRAAAQSLSARYDWSKVVMPIVAALQAWEAEKKHDSLAQS